MAFVNEYVSDEDIKKHDLEKLHREWWGEVPPRFRYTWTVDRERDHYLIFMRRGREEYSNQVRGVLYFNGVHWDVEVFKDSGGSHSFSEIPYRIVWGLSHIKHPHGGTVPDKEVSPVLKSALEAYKVAGVTNPKKLTNVATTFLF